MGTGYNGSFVKHQAQQIAFCSRKIFFLLYFGHLLAFVNVFLCIAVFDLPSAVLISYYFWGQPVFADLYGHRLTGIHDF